MSKNYVDASPMGHISRGKLFPAKTEGAKSVVSFTVAKQRPSDRNGNPRTDYIPIKAFLVSPAQEAFYQDLIDSHAKISVDVRLLTVNTTKKDAQGKDIYEFQAIADNNSLDVLETKEAIANRIARKEMPKEIEAVIEDDKTEITTASEDGNEEAINDFTISDSDLPF